MTLSYFWPEKDSSLWSLVVGAGTLVLLIAKLSRCVFLLYLLDDASEQT